MKKFKIYGIIVTYRPDIDLLKNCIYSIVNQLDKIIIVDNTPEKCTILEKIFNSENIEIVYLENNYGIAYAQNIGIKKAMEEKVDYILLSDQDTIYPADYVERMITCFTKENIAACGPLFRDINNEKNKPFFIKKGKIGFKKFFPINGKHEVFQLIASGTIINTKYLIDIGLMKEELFIDWVDMEWCWRAIKKGYKIIGNAEVLIHHKYGDESKKFFGRFLSVRNPIRYYYNIRNGIFLSLYSDTLNTLQRIILFYKNIRNAIFLFPLTSRNSLLTIKYTIKGLYHGLIGKLGKLDE